MKNFNLYLISLVFFFLLLQSSVVWINEEILLVISFVLFYVLCYLQLRNSLNEFFIERRLVFQNNFFVFLKDLAIKDLKAQKQFQYFKNINLANMAIDTLEKEEALFRLAKRSLQTSQKKVFEKRCLDLLKFEEFYKAELLSLLTSELLKELFTVDAEKNSALMNDFFSYQVSLFRSEQLK